ncbi:PREDICTED: zinc transporter ZIP11-like [Priapulus caudatus]|uniref:Zinc transporter ZIP11 n=1 Tax=Priapulus caudatus TaxID=37621 RepID=A0ABM1EBC9_PRICU|nr:PREDICTED: zinc transporter ZIP11-like [Priapulus caudatus]
MLKHVSPLLQTLLGTLLTWGVTAAGAALVFGVHARSRRLLDASLGFAAGVMLAASYWSLLEPAIELARNSHAYGEWAFAPVAVGFALGAAFVCYADALLPHLGTFEDALGRDAATAAATDGPIGGESAARRRRRPAEDNDDGGNGGGVADEGRSGDSGDGGASWRRILLLIIAITVHNIPEGLAVGVAFAAVGSTPAATFESARNLAIGVALQNFPEGLAVSLPLRGAGVSAARSFWYGQLSGMVEPAAGLLGALAVTVARPALPYALAFAAGAMVFVVIDDIVPEAQTHGNGRLASVAAAVGFIIMMAMDVGLG